MNYLHVILFSVPAFEGAKIYIYKYFSLGWGGEMIYLWLQMRPSQDALLKIKLLYSASECFISFFGYHFLKSGFGLCLYPYIFAAGKPMYLSSCPLAYLLLFLYFRDTKYSKVGLSLCNCFIFLWLLYVFITTVFSNYLRMSMSYFYF